MNIEITNDTELHHRIMKLNYLKAEQELAIKRNVKELAYSAHPSVLIKNLVGKFTDDKEATSDLKTIGLNLGKDFLLMKLFGKGGVRGFISSMLVKKATDYVIKNHSDLLTSGISKVQSFIGDRKEKVAE
jgi:hypothetical protein